MFAYLVYMLSLCLPLDHKVHENKNIFCLICHNTLSLRRMLRMLKTLFKYLLQKENEKEKLVPGATFSPHHLSFFPSLLSVVQTFSFFISLFVPSIGSPETWLFSPFGTCPRLIRNSVSSCLYPTCRALLGWPCGCTVLTLLHYNKHLASTSAPFQLSLLLRWKRCSLFCMRIIPLLFFESHFL